MTDCWVGIADVDDVDVYRIGFGGIVIHFPTAFMEHGVIFAWCERYVVQMF